jgi:hypothetical protein
MADSEGDDDAYGRLIRLAWPTWCACRGQRMRPLMVRLIKPNYNGTSVGGCTHTSMRTLRPRHGRDKYCRAAAFMGLEFNSFHVISHSALIPSNR